MIEYAIAAPTVEDDLTSARTLAHAFAQEEAGRPGNDTNMARELAYRHFTALIIDSYKRHYLLCEDMGQYEEEFISTFVKVYTSTRVELGRAMIAGLYNKRESAFTPIPLNERTFDERYTYSFRDRAALAGNDERGYQMFSLQEERATSSNVLPPLFM